MGEIDGYSERIDATSGTERVLKAFPVRFLHIVRARSRLPHVAHVGFDVARR